MISRPIGLRSFVHPVAQTLLVAALAGCGGGGSDSSTPAASADAPSPKSDTSTQFAPQAPTLQLSSYENKLQAIEALGPLALSTHFSPEMATSLLQSNTYAFGDFFGNGKLGLIAHTFEYNFDANQQDRVGKILAFELINGKWSQRSLQIDGGNSGCLHPRKAVVSDFNQDGMADVFIACTGYDAPPFPGESSILLTQTANGFDKNHVAIPGANYVHGASAADLNGDGLADLVVANMSRTKADGPGCEGTAVLINQGDLSFKAEPSLIKDYDYCRTAYSAELMRLGSDTHYSLLLSGHGSDTQGHMQAPQLFKWKDGQFHADLLLPAVPHFGLVLDAVYRDGNLYALRTMDEEGQFYQADMIQKIPLENPAQAAIVYEHHGVYANQNSWINWIGFYQGKLVSQLAEFGLNLTP